MIKLGTHFANPAYQQINQNEITISAIWNQSWYFKQLSFKTSAKIVLTNN